MGHVDHGKTSLLDALRKTDVVSGEHMAASPSISALSGCGCRTASALPSLIRRATLRSAPCARAGAEVTDIVVLVVAADDGVMPQTVEAIHTPRFGRPIISQSTRSISRRANPTRALTDLLQHEIVTEAHGGDTLAVEVSALKKTGLDKLVETILLQAEVMDLKANRIVPPKRR